MAAVAQSTQNAPVPPQNLDAEESVLGAMMLSPGAIGAVSEVLDAGDFYRESHAKIYRASLSLYARGEPVDAITLVDELEERGDLEGAGGRERIHELAALVPATANAAHYAKIVREMATLRGLIRVGAEVARLGWERPGEAAELVDQAEQIVFELSQSRVSSEFSHIEALLKESFERITQLYEAGEDLTGVPSGFREIDRLTGGFQPGNLIIVAARPSMGKSALALGMAANLGVRTQIPVALFTLEMSKSEVTQRLMCSEAKVESNRLRTGKLAVDDWPRLTAACDKLAKAPIYVDDTGSITMMEIRAKARRLKTQQPTLGLIIVDYLQLMTSGASVENRVQEVSQISRQLKVLARDLDVPVLAMSQLSRAVEQRHDKRPILSDLRESGAIEQDAGPRLLHLPRRVLQRGVRPAGPRRSDLRETPQRPDGLGEALVPQALREVRGPGCLDGRAAAGLTEEELAFLAHSGLIAEEGSAPDLSEDPSNLVPAGYRERLARRRPLAGDRTLVDARGSRSAGTRKESRSEDCGQPLPGLRRSLSAGVAGMLDRRLLLAH